MLKKICRCGKVIGYGEECCTRKRQNRKVDNSFYHDRKWRRTREKVLSDYHYVDVYAYYNGGDKRATTVHHIVEVDEDESKRYDLHNLFPCSLETHNKIHARYERDKAGTQRELRELKERWNRAYPPG